MNVYLDEPDIDTHFIWADSQNFAVTNVVDIAGKLISLRPLTGGAYASV